MGSQKCEFYEKWHLQCEFCVNSHFENVNFVKNEIFKMWSLWNKGSPKCELCGKMTPWKCEFCGKNRVLKMWIL